MWPKDIDTGIPLPVDLVEVGEGKQRSELDVIRHQFKRPAQVTRCLTMRPF
jgi:hypothetical protein